MLDPAANVWADRGRSAEAGDAPRRNHALRVVSAWRANPFYVHVQETIEVNITAGG